jgi:hypothetical protein
MRYVYHGFGGEATRRLKQEWPDLKVLGVTSQ